MTTDCELCSTPILAGEPVTVMTFAEPTDDQGYISHLRRVHRECILRSVVGGIGHLRDHAFWCGVMGDPDGGMTYRESALACQAWYAERQAP